MQTYVPILYMHMGKDTRIFISIELRHTYDFRFLSICICTYVHIWVVLVLEVELGSVYGKNSYHPAILSALTGTLLKHIMFF